MASVQTNFRIRQSFGKIDKGFAIEMVEEMSDLDAAEVVKTTTFDPDEASHLLVAQSES